MMSVLGTHQQDTTLCNLDVYTCAYGPTFILIYTPDKKLVKILAPLPGRSFMLILIIVQLDITLDLFSLFAWLFCLHKCL